MLKASHARSLPALALLLGLACHPKPADDAESLIGRAQSIPRQTEKVSNLSKRWPGLKSSQVAILPDKSVGPFLARRPGVAMGAYLGTGEGGSRRVVSLPLAIDGTPRDAKVVAGTLADSTTLVLRPAGGEGGAFVAAWTELTDRGESLSVAGVGADGGASIPPVELERTTDDIVWVDVVATPRGEICVWAEETRGGDANLLAVALEPSGKPRGVPSRIARGATAWQVVPSSSGVGLAVVTPVAAKVNAPAAATASPGAGGSSLGWLKLDGEARPVGPVTPVATSAARITDVDLAVVKDSTVFAWTERSEADPDVFVASLDAEGHPRPAHAVTARMGGAKLAALASGKAKGLLVWEEARHRPRPLRRLHVVRLGENGDVEGDAVVVEADPGGPPELSSLDDGFAMLTRGRTCPDPLEPRDTPCAESTAVPVFLRFDLALHVAETEPIRLDEGADMATFAWGLSCDGTQCLTLAAGTESPAKVRAVELTEMPNRWHAPVLPVPAPGQTPRVLSIDSVHAGDLFADVAVTPLTGAPSGQEGSLAVAVTSTSADSDKGGAARGATLSVRPLDAAGVARGPAVTLTKRAQSIGGVGIAPAPKGDGAAVVWTAREGEHAQAHVSRVDRKGSRTRDVQLTSSRGEVGDVAIAATAGGFLVAWVDTRDGNGEVYATKLDLELNRVAREERITNAPGDATDVTLAGAGGDAWLAWADPRESPHDGFADIFVTKLAGATAKPMVPESRVLATAAHSRSPSLAYADLGPAIGWIEEAPMSAGSQNSGAYGAILGNLDASGHLVGDVVRTHGAGDGFPTAVAIERGASALRVVLTRAARDELSLDAFELSPGKEPRPSLLFVMDGPPSLDVSLSLVEGAVYLNDEGVDVGDGRTRRIALAWSR